MIYLYTHCPFTESIVKVATVDGFLDDQIGHTLGIKVAWRSDLEFINYLSLRGMTLAKEPLILHLILDPKRNPICEGCTRNKLKCKGLPDPETDANNKI